jgi:hypothetical protein
MKQLVSSTDAVTTYRYVRLGLVALVAFLTASVIDTWRKADGWQNSISAYFYTSSHSVFIASLCAIGICLIVYKGSTTTEDALLNFSGVLALVVGLVPTGREALRGPGLPCDFDARAFVDNNVRALLIASVAAVAVYLVIGVIRSRLDTPLQAELVCPRKDDSPPNNDEQLPPILAAVVGILRRVLSAMAPFLNVARKWLPYLLLTALGAGAAVFFVDLKLFVENAHTVAAYAMFGGIIVVAVHYACYAALRDDREARTRLAFVAGYLLIAALMVVTLITVAILQFSGNGLGLLFVEFVIIGEFALFWLFQSVDLWELEAYQVPSLSELLEKLGPAGPAGPRRRKPLRTVTEPSRIR